MVQAAEEAARLSESLTIAAAIRRCSARKQLLAAGAIGKPVVAELTNHMWFDGTGSRSWLVDPAKAGRRPAVRHRLAPHRRSEFSFWPAAASVTAQLSNAVHHYAVEDNATVMIEYPERRSRSRGCALALEDQPRRMPNSRHRRRDRNVPAERAGLDLPGRTRESAGAREPALSDDRELCGRCCGQISAAGERHVVLLDGLGHRASAPKA